MTSVQRALPLGFSVPSTRFTVRTRDGVTIIGDRLDGRGVPDVAGDPAVVLAHGLMGFRHKPRFARFAEHLAANFPVYAYDSRGHGDSEGVSDFGGAEMFDVEAVLGRARADGYGRVLTVGTSMGAIAVLRHGGLLGGADAVVSISSLAYWDWHGGAQPKAARAMRMRTATEAGRTLARAWGVRLPDRWQAPEAPEEVIGMISPTPVVIVHGENDHLFGPDHARRLYEAAGEPKRLLLGDRFGHAEDGLTAAFTKRLARVIREVMPP